MYSPVARPSRTRAAPAKNRIWSTMGGISSDRVKETGFPVFSLSMATSSSAFSSMTSASLRRALCRSDGVDQRHVWNASPAALQARSTSTSSERGADAYTSPVEGLTMSIIAPEALGRTSPLMMLWKTLFSDIWCLLDLRTSDQLTLVLLGRLVDPCGRRWRSVIRGGWMQIGSEGSTRGAGRR